MKKFVVLLSFLSLFLISAVILSYVLISFNFLNLKNKIYEKFPNIELRKYVFKKESFIEQFQNDYNVKFLPYTQFEELSFSKKKIIFSEEYYNNKNQKISISYKSYGSFYIDIYKNDLILTDYQGEIYLVSNLSEKINSDLEIIKPTIVKTNLEVDRVLDTLIYKNKIFVSFKKKVNDCNTINISYANLESDTLLFEKLFSSEECKEDGAPGRMQFYIRNNEEGLLMSTADGTHNKPSMNAQRDNSVYGKILFIPFETSKKILYFSKGHRVVQGLYTDLKMVISTEHGPRGGDEINIINENGNYGWPLASLGEKYDFKYGQKNISYIKDHKVNNFSEPIFSFIEGIGISEIIKLPKNFSIFYDNHFILSSLNGRSIYFLKFDDQFTKILTLEKIFVNNRIRDLKYFNKSRTLVLALEENGELGFLKKK